MPNQIRSVELHDLYVCRRGDEEIPVYPLTVGVTGHRRILETAVEAAREQTRDLLTRLAEYWRKEQGARGGETSPAPLVVFDGLAAGADSLVAEEVVRLKQTRPELNVKLVAVLPAPQTIYEQDFTSSDELDAFRRLLGKADAVVEIDLTEDNRRWLEKNPGAELPWDYRKAQYEALGRSLAESSLYVLALWDGVEARLENDETVVADERGGTADVVRMKTTASAFAGESPLRLETTANDSRVALANGAVFHIVAPRSDAISSESEAGRFFVCLPQAFGEKTTSSKERRLAFDDFNAFLTTRRAGGDEVKKPLKETALFNRDAVENYVKTREIRRDSIRYLLGNDYVKLDDDAKFLVERYAVADAIAIWFQGRFFRLASWYFGLFALFTVASCANNIKAAPGPFLWVTAYYLTLIVLVGLFWGQKKSAYYERHHRYRALAEALRVQIFWRVAGMSNDVRVGYWTHQIKELDWLRFTVKSASAAVGSESGVPDYRLAFERWVVDQRAFLETKIATFQEQERFWGTLGRCFAFGGLIGVVIRVIDDNWPQPAQCLTTIALAAASFLAFSCFTWNRLKAYGSQRKRYVKLLPIYRYGEATLAALETKAEKQDADVASINRDRQSLLCYLGATALSENADWFLAKRKLELPK